jgi:uncharacterized protein YecT (DUF1311 family)
MEGAFGSHQQAWIKERHRQPHSIRKKKGNHVRGPLAGAAYARAAMASTAMTEKRIFWPQ